MGQVCDHLLDEVDHGRGLGDVVADPFMGSASVGLAALRLGRRFWGNDLSERSVSIATERLSQQIGMAATEPARTKSVR
jgi:DNA modification methylase